MEDGMQDRRPDDTKAISDARQGLMLRRDTKNQALNNAGGKVP
jgi:hypothetical protein